MAQHQQLGNVRQRIEKMPPPGPHVWTSIPQISQRQPLIHTVIS